MNFLLIDTSTERGIIAYGNSQNRFFERELPFGLSQSKFVMPYLEESLKPFGFPPILNAIAVGIGPGSYTGIRLGTAIAQALAFCWKVPLIGLSSLSGFVPKESITQYAAILDARIGGVYFQKGVVGQKEFFQEDPQIYSLDELGLHLEGVNHFVTPSAKTLQIKLNTFDPNSTWIWEERAPSISTLMQLAETKFLKGEIVSSPNRLELLYLRQTEAERKKVDHKSSFS